MAQLRQLGDNPDFMNPDGGQSDDPMGGGGSTPEMSAPNAGADTGAGDAGSGHAATKKGQAGESPRERQETQVGQAAVSAALRPPTPTPQAGQASVGTPAPAAPPQGVIPFQPMSTGPSPVDTATPRLRGLYGSAGGLQGGGLGVPFNSAQNSPIDSLLRQLMQMQQG